MRTLLGTVTSARMAKTVVVRVERLARHPRYAKYYRRSRSFAAHVEGGHAPMAGDVVEIVETRPRSRTKRWRVARIVARRADEAAGTSEYDGPPIEPDVESAP